MTTSKLYRILKPTTPLFQLYPVNTNLQPTPTPVLNDNTIHSITINRPIDSPSTCEIEYTKRGQNFAKGGLVAVELTPPALLPKYANATRRFTGITISTSENIKTIIGGRPNSTKTITAVGMSRRLATEKQITTANKTSFAALWINTLGKVTGVPHYYYAPAIKEAYFHNPETKTYSAASLTSAIKKAGHQIIELRTGQIVAQDYQRPIEKLNGNRPKVVIEANHVRSGLGSETVNEYQNYSTVGSYYLNATPDVEQKPLHVWQELTSSGAIAATEQTIEWEAIDGILYPGSEYPERVVAADLLRRYSQSQELKSITLDILSLAKSPYETAEENAAALRLIGEILAAESGDMILLGSSFGPYTGTYQIKEIRESISDSHWTIGLEIAPASYITGIPEKFRTWNQAPFPWDSPEMTDWTS